MTDIKEYRLIKSYNEDQLKSIEVQFQYLVDVDPNNYEDDFKTEVVYNYEDLPQADNGYWLKQIDSITDLLNKYYDQGYKQRATVYKK